MQTFFSRGKILLTSEYFVLDGALALALPTKLGQTLQYECVNKEHAQLRWIAKDADNTVWLQVDFSLPNFEIKNASNHALANTLQNILLKCNLKKPNFFDKNLSHVITTRLQFSRNWGLGSSSTFINNLAYLFDINAYELNSQTFATSGYDIASAQHKNPIFYRRYNDGTAAFSNATFNPEFRDKLFFVYQNEKQDTKLASQWYRSIDKPRLDTVKKLSEITTKIDATHDFEEFSYLVLAHENCIAEFLEKQTIKSEKFSDFDGAMKSLGAWGGDFILACGDKDYVNMYFIDKGYTTILSWSDLFEFDTFVHA